MIPDCEPEADSALPAEEIDDSASVNAQKNSSEQTPEEAAADPTDQLRDRDFGPYHILAPIGQGGTSRVFLGTDRRDDKLLALKILLPSKARARQRLVARFLREMEWHRRLSHPALPQTHDTGIIDGLHFIAMEFIPGQSLFQLVRKEGALTVPCAARLFAEAASALEHAHELGLIHRDLKPSNILVTPDGHAKVLDVGLAIVQGESTPDYMVTGGPGYVVGSVDYMAPEQVTNPLAVDPRTDIYALGCVLYFALTGQPPFVGGERADKVRRHVYEDPIPVETLNPHIPPDFATLVRRMMAKEPKHRFARASSLQRELLFWSVKIF